MNRFINQTKGAVSIFLIIILIPVMTMAGLFVDLGRTKLSSGVISSSADLALNTVLSKYDKDLKDYYGMIASAQNMDDVLSISKEFFKSSMISAGVDTNQAEEFVDGIVDAFVGDEDISDSLLLSVDGDVSITPATNGALNNPALVKKNIVEFMKYRSPINGVASLFEDISNSDATEGVKDSSAEANLVDAKQDFYEAEKKLMKQAQQAYKAIKKYEDFKAHDGNKLTSDAFWNGFSSLIVDSNGNCKIEADYKTAHEKMVKNLHNTHDTTGTLKSNLMGNVSISSQSSVNTYSTDNTASADKIKELLNSFNSALSNYKNKRQSLTSAWNNLGSKKSTDYDVQYWVQLTNKCSSKMSEYATASQNLWKAANKLKNAVDHPATDAMKALMLKPSNSYVTFPSTNALNQLSLQQVYDALWNSYTDGAQGEVTGGGCSAFKNVNSQVTSLNNSGAKSKIELTTVNNIYTLNGKLKQYRDDFNAAADLLKKAKDETADLKSKLKAYKEAFEVWDEAARVPELAGNELANSDIEEIDKLKETGIEKFSEDSVDALVDRLSNIKTVCTTLSDDIEGIKYKSTKVIDITGYTKFRAASGLNANKIVVNNNSLNSYVSETFSFTIEKQLTRIIIHEGSTAEFDNDAGGEYVISDPYNPSLTQTELELYKWLYKTFSNSPSGQSISASDTGFSYDVNSEESADKADGDIEDKSENATVDTTENISGKNVSEYSGAALPSSNTTFETEEVSLADKIANAADFASGIFSNFSDTFGSAVASVRDDLFTVDYIMNMFTYDTFENEGYYSLLTDSEKESANTIPGAISQYEIVKNDTNRGVWNKHDDSRTLTLNYRNASNNWAYGAEVEYILYGNKSNAANKALGYSQIYLLRYAMDVAAVFKAYYNDPLVVSIADVLQALAYIPAPFTKTMICLAVTAAEAGIDLAYLKTGLPVVLVKGEDDLVCNYENVFKSESASALDVGDKIALQYSDYIKIFLFIKLIGDKENDIYLRTGDIIQMNMSLVSGDGSYALSKANMYYTLNAKVIMEPMWSRLLAVDNLGDVTTEKAWRTTNITITNGY